MTDRDRLIELISQIQYMGGLESRLANHLLANGVIVPPNELYSIVDKGTIDVVKVVKCKECKNASSPDKHSCYCDKFEEFVLLNDYCSYGELKEREVC